MPPPKNDCLKPFSWAEGIGELTDHLRGVVFGLYLAGTSTAEIARLMHINRKTVYSSIRISKGMVGIDDAAESGDDLKEHERNSTPVEIEERRGLVARVMKAHDAMMNIESGAQTLWGKLSGKVSDEHVCEFKRFIVIKVVEGDNLTMRLSPSPLVDQVWHHALLYPRDYLLMCIAACPMVDGTLCVIDHNPDGANDQSAQAVRYQRTLDVYKELFGMAPPKSIWPPHPDAANTINEFRVRVRGLSGTSTFVSVNSQQTVLALKEIVQNCAGIAADQQRLIFAGEQLENDRTVGSYNIVNNSVIHLVLLLTGC